MEPIGYFFIMMEVTGKIQGYPSDYLPCILAYVGSHSQHWSTPTAIHPAS